MFGHAYTGINKGVAKSATDKKSIPNRAAPKSKPSSPLTSPPQSAQRQEMKSSRATSASERRTNPLYNHELSRDKRVQRPNSACKGLSFGSSKEDRLRSVITDRPVVQSSLQKPKIKKLPVSKSRSDIIKRTPLEAECQERAGQRPNSCKPKTLVQDDNENTVSDTPKIDKNVFLAVKEMLSRAVVEKGQIDKNNIENILLDMKRHLNGEEALGNEDSRSNTKLEGKSTKTMVNVNLTSEEVCFRNPRPLAGIVRMKDTSSKKGHNSYTKVYNRPETLINKQTPSSKGLETDQKGIVYIELPDPDYSNFNTIMRKDGENTKADCSKIKVEPAEIKSTQRNVSHIDIKQKCSKNLNKEGVVGDCRSKASGHHLTLLNGEDNEKLELYIMTLVQNLSNQLKEENLFHGKDKMETDQTVGQSTCVCKAGFTKNESPKEKLIEETTSCKVKTAEQSELKLKSSIGCSSRPASIKKPRQTKLFSKESSTDSQFKVLKRNENFQPESIMNISPHSAKDSGVRCEDSMNKPFAAVVPGVVEEGSEDLYLKRRISKSASKNKTSSKI